MPYVQLTEDRIDTALIQHIVERPEYGAAATFTGNVRDNANGKRVLSLEYTAYRLLATREMERIAEEAERRWGGTCAVSHRLGMIPIGQASVAIAYGSAHRPEAFEACRWVIDTLKETVPIWKRETYEDGDVWIEGDQSVPAAAQGAQA